MKTGVLLLAYGAADSLDEIGTYLQDILGDRPVPEPLVAEIKRRYEKMGGRSPLKEITAAQARGLSQRLGEQLPVFVGMRHSAPWIKDAVCEMREEGVERIVAVPLTPYDSKLSVGAYLLKLGEAILSTGGPLDVKEVRGWHLHPKLIEAYADRIAEASSGFDPKTVLLLTAHSLPERIVKDGDPYPKALADTAAAIHAKTPFQRMEFAYQSAGGGGRGPWLGPDAGETLERLKAEGVESVLLSPIGFVCEHMETLYDDDILFREKALGLGLRFGRVAALNDHPAFLDALAETVRAA
ncbi:MAG: ferrochelatase [Elusimicrobia bacterium CG1_02_63_36]|nr:MAG: ferrochelatase [Elusimicrobia bacterium CG1_02_63_36]